MSDRFPSKRRRWFEHTQTVAAAVIVVFVAVALNAVFSQVHWRLDMTSERMYTLSPVSQQAAGELDEPVEIRAIISADMPPPYHRLDEQIEQLLMEYQAASNSHINYQIISPTEDDDIQELASGYGIEAVTIGQHTETRRSVRSVYKGVSFIQGDRLETIADLQVSGRHQIDNFEYEFTKALKNLHRQQPRRIGIATGLGGPADRPQFIEHFGHLFEQMYGQLVEVEAVEIGDDRPIDDDIATLVAVNIDSDVGEAGLRRLDQFIQHGGNIGWFQSGATVDEDHRRRQLDQLQAGGPTPSEGLSRRATQTDLIDYFRSMGLHFRADAVIDRHRAIAHGVVPTRRGAAQVSHPALFPIDDVARELPFARHFSTLVIPLPSTIDIDSGTLADSDVDVFDVLKTPDSSVRLPGPPEFALYDDLLETISGEQQGSYTVAAAVQGDIPPHFTGTDRPDDERESRILVVGSGDFIGEYPEVGYLGELTGLGMQFFLASVEWLAQHDELADIRGKAMPALVAEVPRSAQRSMKFINIVVVPALFGSIGIIMMIRRRRRKEQFEDQ